MSAENPYHYAILNGRRVTGLVEAGHRGAAKMRVTGGKRWDQTRCILELPRAMTIKQAQAHVDRLLAVSKQIQDELAIYCAETPQLPMEGL